MKTNLLNKKHGSTMLATALLALVVAGALVSYLLLVSSENISVARSQSWNSSLTITESGIEDGLALINKYAGTATTLTNWAMTATTEDGWDTADETTYKNLQWTYPGSTTVHTWRDPSGTVYHVKRAIDPSTGYYDIYVNNPPDSTTSWGPEMLAIGYANWTTTSLSGEADVSLSIKGPPRRAIYVQSKPITQLLGGIVSAHNITFNGNNVTIDSWNSDSNAYSIWHTNWFFKGNNYGTWSNSLSMGGAAPSRTANVVVATGDASIDTANANIYGYIDSGPGGSDSFKTQGSVGDFTWVPHSGIQPGHSRDDINKVFTSKSLPTPTNLYQTTWLALPSPTNFSITISGSVYTNSNYPNLVSGNWHIRGQTYKYVIQNNFPGLGANYLGAATNVYYQYGMPGNSQFSDSLFIDASNVVIFLTNGMNTPTITLNTNADVQFWCEGSITATGNGEIDNQTSYTHAFSIYDVAGHPLSSFTLHGHGVGTGYIYAPSSDITFAGGAGEGDVVGAIFCNSISISGTYQFHFDETLKTALPADRFETSQWKEVMVQQ